MAGHWCLRGACLNRRRERGTAQGSGSGSRRAAAAPRRRISHFCCAEKELFDWPYMHFGELKRFGHNSAASLDVTSINASDIKISTINACQTNTSNISARIISAV